MRSEGQSRRKSLPDMLHPPVGFAGIGRLARRSGRCDSTGSSSTSGTNRFVAEKALLFGSSRNDSLTALDTETGVEKWRFYADSPVRLAPAVWAGKVYFGSDDGSLYCLDVADGRLLWKRRASPSSRKVLGETAGSFRFGPVRGGPVVADGQAFYFAAGRLAL